MVGGKGEAWGWWPEGSNGVPSPFAGGFADRVSRRSRDRSGDPPRACIFDVADAVDVDKGIPY